MTRSVVLSGDRRWPVVMPCRRAAVVAQQPAAAGPNVAGIEKVKDNLYMVTGGGGNTAVFVTANGVVLVDTKLANWGQAIMDKVKTVTDKPVTHIINTHTHGDHVGSNEYFPASVEIVAHANVSTSMAKMPAFADGTKKHAFPDKTYTDKLTVLSGNDAIDLYYFGAGAHQRRHLRRVPQPAGDARRRRLLGQGHAAPRRQQRRQRRDLSRTRSPR